MCLIGIFQTYIDAVRCRLVMIGLGIKAGKEVRKPGSFVGVTGDGVDVIFIFTPFSLCNT